MVSYSWVTIDSGGGPVFFGPLPLYMLFHHINIKIFYYEVLNTRSILIQDSHIRKGYYAKQVMTKIVPVAVFPLLTYYLDEL